MNSLDIIFAVFLAIFVFIGILRGFFREVLGLVGVIGGIILGFVGFEPFASLLNRYLPGIPSFVWPFLCFILIFIAVYLGCRLLAHILSRISEKIYLGWLNRLLGGLVGGFKGALFISVVLLLIGFLPVQGALIHVKNQSKLYGPLQNLLSDIYDIAIHFSSSSNDFEKILKEKIQKGKIKTSAEMLKYLFKEKSETIHGNQ